MDTALWTSPSTIDPVQVYMYTLYDYQGFNLESIKRKLGVFDKKLEESQSTFCCYLNILLDTKCFKY